MNRPVEWWFSLELDSAGNFQVGDQVQEGARLGTSLGGEIVQAAEKLEILSIQYDIDSYRLILACARPRFAAA